MSPGRAEPRIPRKSISPNARRVIDVLHKGGHSAYVVGGAVRDLALGLAPKDFDVATSATPEQVRHLLKRARIYGRIIGRRFRLVHARFASEIIEVSTFRKMAASSDVDATGRLLSDNVFGTEEEDAWRRDFTANALFYDPASGKVVDYTGGLADIERRQLRIIGDPAERYREDPVRMLRAIRIATKLSLRLERRTSAAIAPNLHLLENVPSARLFDELTKIIKGGSAHACLSRMAQTGMISLFIPHYREMSAEAREWLGTAMMMSDRRVHQGETVSITLFVACMFWPDIRERYRAEIESGTRSQERFHRLFERSRLAGTRLVTGRVRQKVIETWTVMARMETASRARQVESLRRHDTLRSALAFLRQRAESDESLVPTVMKWEEIAEANPAHARETARRLFDFPAPSGKGRRRRPPPGGQDAHPAPT